MVRSAGADWLKRFWAGAELLVWIYNPHPGSSGFAILVMIY
jgi:hypothetical protein